MLIKPMLAAKRKVQHQFKFPLWVTPKIDGIRCLNDDGRALSRSFKSIPNKFIQEFFYAKLRAIAAHGLDGELDLHPIGDLLSKRRATFQEVSSAITSIEGEPDFIYRVFDIQGTDGYMSRMGHLTRLQNLYGKDWTNRIEILHPVEINNQVELDVYTQKQLDAGWEGAMARVGSLPYRVPRGGGENRSTFNEGYLIKIKPLESDEAEIVGFEEEMQNTNEQVTDEIGRMKRSHHQEGMVGKGTLGALVCKSPLWPDVTFNLGSGITDALAREIWGNQSYFLGKKVTYKYQEIGSLDRPRQPVFVGIRSALDMGAPV